MPNCVLMALAGISTRSSDVHYVDCMESRLILINRYFEEEITARTLLVWQIVGIEIYAGVLKYFG